MPFMMGEIPHYNFFIEIVFLPHFLAMRHTEMTIESTGQKTNSPVFSVLILCCFGKFGSRIGFTAPAANTRLSLEDFQHLDGFQNVNVPVLCNVTLFLILFSDGLTAGHTEDIW